MPVHCEILRVYEYEMSVYMTRVTVVGQNNANELIPSPFQNHPNHEIYY